MFSQSIYDISTSINYEWLRIKFLTQVHCTFIIRAQQKIF